jgi:hypothetical protein
MPEFAADNSISSTTTVTPFFANKGFPPLMSQDLQPIPITELKDRLSEPIARKFGTAMQDLWEFLKEQTELAEVRMERYANATRKPAPRYEPGDEV